MGKLDAVEALDDNARQQTFSHHSAELALLDDVLLCLNEGLGGLSGRIHAFTEEDPDELLLLLVHNGFTQLWRGRAELLDGYMGQSMALAGGAAESALTFLYIDAQPDQAGLWLRQVEAEEGEHRPNLWKRSFKFLDTKGALGQGLKDVVDLLSRLGTRGNRRSLGSIIRPRIHCALEASTSGLRQR
jgi:hypothetical protein